METDSDSKEILEAQLRECYGRVVWTHKTHEKCADILNTWNQRFKISQIVLSAFITTGIFAVIWDDCKMVEIISAVLSLFLLCLNSYLKSFDLGGLAQKHAEAAADLLDIRESYLSLLTDLKIGSAPVEDVMKRRDFLQEKLVSVYKGCPRTISKAYAEATKALKENEEMTFSKEEINRLLPEKLRI